MNKLLRRNDPTILKEAAKGRQTKKPILLILIFVAVFMVTSTVASIPSGIYSGIAIAPQMSEYVHNSLNDVSSLDLNTLMDVLTKAEDMIMSDGTFALISLFSTVITTILVLIFVTKIEKRSAYSMGFAKKGWAGLWLVGGLIGSVMFALAVGICMLTGTMKFGGYVLGGNLVSVILYFFGFMLQGMSEEVLCRGFLMTSWGSKGSLTAAVLVSSLLFSMLHLANPNFGLIAFVNIFLFGLLEALLILRCDSIWLACGLHSLWNFVQGNVFGVLVSGGSYGSSIFKFESTVGGKLINGGDFGIEGGLACTAVEVIAIIIILVWKGRKSEKAEA